MGRKARLAAPNLADAFSPLEATRCDAIIPAQNVELFAVGIAGKLRTKLEEVYKSAGPATLPPIRGIDQAAQLAHMREHFRNRSLLRHANCVVRPKAVELLKELLRASHGFGNLPARHLHI